MLFITDQQVADNLDITALVDAMAQALQDFSEDRVTQPERSIVPTPEGGFIGLMPAIYPDVMGVKLVTYGPENRTLALPSYHAIINLFDTKTGVPLATFEGGFITDLRTAAVSAVAIKVLAASNPRKKLAVLGSGAQARAHLKVLQHVYSFDEIHIWSRSYENAQALAGKLQLMAASTVEEAVADADVIVSASSANQPILQGKWVRKGAHVTSVGAFGPNNRELDDDVMTNIVVVDSRRQAAKESGDIIASGARVYAELGELLAGTKPVPQGQTTVFKSVGMAVEDVAAAKLVFCTLAAATV